MVYFGDERGNIRVIDISDAVVKYSKMKIEKLPYYPTQKTSFILNRKGFYQLDSISDSLIKMTRSQSLPPLCSYTEYCLKTRKCHSELGTPKAVELLKYLIEPEIFISSGADKKIKFYNLRIEL